MSLPTFSPPDKLVLVIADDHPLVRNSLRLLFECVPWVGRIELCGDGLELWDRACAVSADIVITDLSMPRLDGLSSIRRLRRHDKALVIIAISGAEHYFPEPEVLEAGADAYLSKHRSGEDIVSAITDVLMRHDRHAVRKTAHAETAMQLSEREREVLKLLAEGFGLDETAAMLHISPATIRKHREHLYKKLGTSNTAKLTLIAVHMGLV
jgi:DNA-binding NarL/FixJ family response regulator